MYIGIDPDAINNTSYNSRNRARAGNPQLPMRAGVIRAVAPEQQRDPWLLDDVLEGVLERDPTGYAGVGTGPVRNDSAGVQRAYERLLAKESADGSAVMSPLDASRLISRVKLHGSAAVTVMRGSGALGRVQVNADDIITRPGARVDDLLRSTMPAAAARRAAGYSDTRAAGYGWRTR